MKAYRYQDLTVGMEESFKVIVTEDMMREFQEISGDENPLHTDAEFAREMGYDHCVVYGLLTASFLSKLAGMYLPGKNCLIQSIEVNFVKPVFVGDELKISGIVKELNNSVRQAVLKVAIINQNDEKVLRGKMKVGVLDER